MADSNIPTAVKEPPAALSKALAHLLRPLVRLLLHFQITYPSLSNLLKQVYVEMAEQSFPLDGKPQTDSRISLLTGVHRKDVKRLRHSPTEPPCNATASLGSQLIARWLSEKEYQHSDGTPKKLPKAADKGPSFASLVASVAKHDIRPGVVLDEWLRLGAAHIDEDGSVCLNTEAFVPQHGFDDKAYFFGKHLHDHISAGANNLLGALPPQFDRGVFYNRLTPESIEQLQGLIEQQASALLKSINKEAKSLQEQDRGKSGARQQFNLGVYFWVEKEQKKERGQ
ncbi:conserved hypothetical protein [Hahella chejuensis KCTC 2396]|uniref:Uncharacterized protein n=1 Tax=Hahella chejuensis (strain KCTC 2396) TaxID=349521 RepID=Q2SGV0_HAHCH|nr:DUF6502 family protein [Hahella chejuensis]ABC30124.1 conserved hypothetical protein [Hahella chejuensis KCTC 2396]